MITGAISTSSSSGIGVGGEGSPIAGPPGASAYALALQNGFIGTEVEWLASLKADPAPPAPSGFIIGEGPPSTLVGTNGQLYVDAEVPALYGPKTLGSWGTPTLFVRLITGQGAPTPATGRHSQVYLDTTNLALYGPKRSNEWGPPAPLSPLMVGIGAPARAFGANGQVYYDPSTLTIYGPKANGEWPAGLSLVGPQPLKALAPWQTATAYVVGPPASYVSQGGSSYACLVNHTSGTFAADLAAGKWGVVALKGVDGTNGTNGTNGLVQSVAGISQAAISATDLRTALGIGTQSQADSRILALSAYAGNTLGY